MSRDYQKHENWQENFNSSIKLTNDIVRKVLRDMPDGEEYDRSRQIVALHTIKLAELLCLFDDSQEALNLATANLDSAADLIATDIIDIARAQRLLREQRDIMKRHLEPDVGGTKKD